MTEQQNSGRASNRKNIDKHENYFTSSLDLLSSKANWLNPD